MPCTSGTPCARRAAPEAGGPGGDVPRVPGERRYDGVRAHRPARHRRGGGGGGGGSVGHASGRRIAGLLGTRKADLSDADFAHMRKVNGYVHRHLAQRPDGDVADSAWCRSSVNWGHAPEK
ncbi:DUF3140 domain-containing protein [Streptomyces genisteinicus]|uniref:DUF3140 domain-containing protein n=1 Tax=Streptomyces genisteinicus TaxID=2768068 RepID=A0A7H0HM71_9ACTN|nr:DUF3140 domain-containing protein [Streptomyces genisteinicus]